jgi:Uma2 family endonuclease
MSVAAVEPARADEKALLTAEEFAERYAGQRVELVRGQVVELPMPFWKHGKVCYRITMALGSFVESRDLGHVMTNDSWVVVEHDPDTVRGSDVFFCSYSRLPKGKVPDGLIEVVPELVFEVRSPSDRWNRAIAKKSEYLDAGVSVVVILDPKTEAAWAFRPNGREVISEGEDLLVVPDVLPEFSVPVRALFE